MNTASRILISLSVAFGFSIPTSILASAQEVGQVSYKMGRKAVVSITNLSSSALTVDRRRFGKSAK